MGIGTMIRIVHALFVRPCLTINLEEIGYGVGRPVN